MAFYLRLLEANKKETLSLSLWLRGRACPRDG